MGKVDQVHVLTHGVCHCKGVGKRQLLLMKILKKLTKQV